MASNLDSSPHSAPPPSAVPGLGTSEQAERARPESPSSSGVRAALRSFARDGARVVVLTGDTNRQRFVVPPGAPAQRFRLGTSAECNWTLAAPGVAPLHLELHWDGSDVFVTPLAGSAALLNGSTHRHRFRITCDTMVQLGEATLAVWIGAEPRPEEEARASRPPQTFHVARPPRMIDDASKTRTAMGMVAPLALAAHAREVPVPAKETPSHAEPEAPALPPAREPSRSLRRTEPFFVGGMAQPEAFLARETVTHETVARETRPSVPLPVLRVGAEPSLFSPAEPWPEPPLAESERDGARFLVPAAEPAVLVADPEPPRRPTPSAVRTTVELAVPQVHGTARPLPPPAPSLSARQLSAHADAYGTSPDMRVLTSELTVVDPSSQVLTPRASVPVATPQPAPRDPIPDAESRPASATAPALAPERPAPALASAALLPTRSAAIDLPLQALPLPEPAAATAWPTAPLGAPPIRSTAQARWLDPLPAPQPERPLLATSAALRDRYLRDREAEWETPHPGALRPRVSVLSQPGDEPAPRGGLYWLGISLALLGMLAAPLAIPELREDARELLRRGLRGASALLGREAQSLDRLLPPRPPRAPEISERTR